MLVQEAFPNSDRKRLGKDRQTYIVGIEPSLSVSAMSRAPVQGATPAEDLQEENHLLSRKVNELEAKIRTLEDQACSSLPLELDSLLQHGKYALRGPDTPAHFTEFSVEAIVSEFQKYAPNIYRLFLDLGDTDRCAHTPVEEKKSLVSMCTILNARSRKAHGMQLLMSFMLIARATSRQVCTCIYNKHTLNISMCCGWCCFVVVHFMHTFFVGNDSFELCRGMHVLPEKLGVSTPANRRGRVIASGPEWTLALGVRQCEPTSKSSA